ncbi:MAG TPA: H-type small acid-soluble spore protein [Clostridiales bacterium]|nr:MAG: hypothetical protein A2Y18_07985 [Clostridiales bacterium GWD2_32_19]HCC07870.1 H-type small acid-soluble spore protein [Clostridiales bacterium]
MDIKRVEEVMSSKGVINVEYIKRPVWILDIDRTDNKVIIEGVKDKNLHDKVEAENLQEKQ